MDRVLKEAVGTFGQGRLQLLEFGVRIVRGRNIATIPYDDIQSVQFKPSSAIHSGFISFVPPGTSSENADYAPEKDRTVHFNGRQQKHFEEIKSVVDTHIEGGESPRSGIEVQEASTEAVESPRSLNVETAETESPPEQAHALHAQEAQIDQVVAEESGEAAPPPDHADASAGLQSAALSAMSIATTAVSGVDSEHAANARETESPREETPVPQLDRSEPESTEPVLLPDDQMIPRLAAAGRRIGESQLSSAEAALALSDALQVANGEMARIGHWVAGMPDATETPDGSREHPGVDYLIRGALYLADSASKSLAESTRAMSVGRSLFVRGPNPLESMKETLRLEVGATSVLTIMEAYSNSSSSELDWVRQAPMYEVITAGVAGISRQLDIVANDAASSQPSVMEPFFVNITDTLETLSAVIDDRVSDMTDARTPEQAAGATYLLGCARDSWHKAVDALAEARQLYINVRDHWSSSVPLVLERVGAVVLHVLTGQSIVSMADVYIRADLRHVSEIHTAATE